MGCGGSSNKYATSVDLGISVDIKKDEKVQEYKESFDTYHNEITSPPVTCVAPPVPKKVPPISESVQLSPTKKIKSLEVQQRPSHPHSPDGGPCDLGFSPVSSTQDQSTRSSSVGTAPSYNTKDGTTPTSGFRRSVTFSLPEKSYTPSPRSTSSTDRGLQEKNNVVEYKKCGQGEHTTFELKKEKKGKNINPAAFIELGLSSSEEEDDDHLIPLELRKKFTQFEPVEIPFIARSILLLWARWGQNSKRINDEILFKEKQRVQKLEERNARRAKIRASIPVIKSPQPTPNATPVGTPRNFVENKKPPVAPNPELQARDQFLSEQKKIAAARCDDRVPNPSETSSSFFNEMANVQQRAMQTTGMMHKLSRSIPAELGQKHTIERQTPGFGQDTPCFPMSTSGKSSCLASGENSIAHSVSHSVAMSPWLFAESDTIPAAPVRGTFTTGLDDIDEIEELPNVALRINLKTFSEDTWMPDQPILDELDCITGIETYSGPVRTPPRSSVPGTPNSSRSGSRRPSKVSCQGFSPRVMGGWGQSPSQIKTNLSGFGSMEPSTPRGLTDLTKKSLESIDLIKKESKSKKKTKESKNARERDSRSPREKTIESALDALLGDDNDIPEIAPNDKETFLKGTGKTRSPRNEDVASVTPFSPDRCIAGEYPAGCPVDYYSQSRKKWNPGVVIAVKNGLYLVDKGRGCRGKCRWVDLMNVADKKDRVFRAFDALDGMFDDDDIRAPIEVPDLTKPPIRRDDFSSDED